MNFVTKIILAFNNFFRAVAKGARPAWEFRIRFSLEKRSWVIELHENGDQNWKPLTKLDESTEHELHFQKFESYQEAYQFVMSAGLHLAYEQAHYTHNQRPLHTSSNAAENAVLEATLGTMGATVSRIPPARNFVPTRHGVTR